MKTPNDFANQYRENKEKYSTQQKDNGNPVDVFSAASNTNDLPKFTDELLGLKDKIVEIYIGDQCETLNFEEFSTPKNCVIIGKIVEIFDRVVKLDCFYIDNKTGKLSNGNFIYLNQFQMRVMTVLDGRGALCDVFLDTKNSEKIRKTILSHPSSTKK
jgi:hypothetical protein